MHRSRIVLLGVLVLAAAAVLADLALTPSTFSQRNRAAGVNQSIEIVINAEQQFQTIDGFGSSQRMWRDGHVANASGPPPDIPEAVQEQILSALYRDLGLTRVRTHGVGYNTEPVKGNFRFDCDPGDGCGVDARISYAKQGMRYGLSTVLSENNPMKWMNQHNPEDYADNTLALLLRWRSMGVEPRYQTLMNEPTSSHWANAPWHREVIKALGPRMRAAGLKTMLVVPDDINSCFAYNIASTVFEDPEARRYVGAIAYHLYGRRNPTCHRQVKDLALKYNVPVWMTEHYLKPGYEGALEWANEIHELIANYGVSAVDYMWGFFGDWVMKRFSEEDLVQITFGEGRYISHRLTAKYYITGQFSRYVRPGYRRVGAESADAGVLVTAFRGDGKLAIVVINNNGSEAAANISVRGVSVPRLLSPVRTSPVDNWKVLPTVTPTGARFSVTLAPRSVTTFVGTGE